MCSRASNSAPILLERESEPSSRSGTVAVAISGALGGRDALLRRRRESGDQLHALSPLLESGQLEFDWPSVRPVKHIHDHNFWHCTGMALAVLHSKPPHWECLRSLMRASRAVR